MGMASDVTVMIPTHKCWSRAIDVVQVVGGRINIGCCKDTNYHPGQSYWLRKCERTVFVIPNLLRPS